MNAAAAPFPRLPLFAVITVLGGTLLCAAAARITGFAQPPAPPPAIASTELSFSDLPDGGIAVHDAASGKIVETIAAKNDGFLRTTLRVLAAQRAKEGFGPEKPFLLTSLQGGRLELTDTATGQQVELEAFGPSNIAEFLPLISNTESRS